MQEENQYQTGERNQRHQPRRNVDHAGPGFAGIAAFVQIIDDGDKAETVFHEFVFAGGAVDKAIGRVARAFERNLNLIVIDAKIAQGGANVMARTKRGNHIVLVGIG